MKLIQAVLVATAPFLLAGALAQPALADAPLARSAFKKQEPLPTPYVFHDVDLVSVSEGWAVASPETGDHGYIFHTTNGGKTWKGQGAAFQQLNGISFADALHGVAVGNELRYTLNGGKTWVPGTSPGGTAYDVDLVTTQVAYATTFGAVLKTTNGGQSWVTQPVGVFGNLVGVDFVDADHGWVVGAEGTVFRTTDGGALWVRQRHDTSKFYTGVSFVSTSEGWICANADILHTTDGGTTWTLQPIPSGADAIEVRFFDALNGYAAGALRTLLHTTNGGLTWTRQVGGVFAEPDNRYPFEGLDVASAAVAVAVGNGDSIYTTGNSGQTWNSRGNGSPTLPFRFARTDATHVWSANSNSEVLYTTNGGKNWNRSIIQVSISCSICSNTGDIAFLNNLEGWAVINGDFTSSSWIWHSVDAGKTWQTLGITSTGPLSGLAIVDANTLVAVSGLLDAIYRSVDRGVSWVQVPHPSAGSWFGSVRFVPGTPVGYTVGQGGKILKSVDGGATWTLQRGGGHVFNLIDVSFADVNNGWAVGGEELHTTDGGLTWSSQNTGVFASVSVYAVSPTIAWIGGLSDLAKTTDGGLTWAHEDPSDTDWFALSFVDSANGWAGGQDQAADDVPGSIWHRSGAAEAAPAAPGAVVPVHVFEAPPSMGRGSD